MAGDPSPLQRWLPARSRLVIDDEFAGVVRSSVRATAPSESMLGGFFAGLGTKNALCGYPSGAWSITSGNPHPYNLVSGPRRREHTLSYAVARVQSLPLGGFVAQGLLRQETRGRSEVRGSAYPRPGDPRSFRRESSWFQMRRYAPRGLGRHAASTQFAR